jgi:RNA polymerase sigma factor (sigma-70 family)
VAELSDEKIMQRVRDGDLSELTELFERYHVKLYNFFLKLTFDKAASEDLTQNLFYRVIRYRHTFDRTNGNFKAWLYRIAKNIHADYCRQQSKRKDRFALPEEGDYHAPGHASGHPSGHVPGDGEIYSEAHLEKLNRALARLAPEQRELLVLSRYQGMKYEEICKLKGLSMAATKVQIHRAIKQLRNLYFNQSKAAE